MGVPGWDSGGGSDVTTWRPRVHDPDRKGPGMNLHGRSLLKEIDLTAEEFLPAGQPG